MFRRRKNHPAAAGAGTTATAAAEHISVTEPASPTAASADNHLSSPQPPSPDEITMKIVDVFFLTFNSAKNVIDVSVFATHLLAALRQHAPAAGLPDLVAL